MQRNRVIPGFFSYGLNEDASRFARGLERAIKEANLKPKTPDTPKGIRRRDPDTRKHTGTFGRSQ